MAIAVSSSAFGPQPRPDARGLHCAGFPNRIAFRACGSSTADVIRIRKKTTGGQCACREDCVDLRELLSVPYLLEAEAGETEAGKWLVRLDYPELPGCTAEGFVVEDVLERT